ncbi:hypothetical protein A9Q81_11815 [Gammaproteobacteria bacterium 42_54_T18]|nr:hypothetical protein A9Q81_11815 [Gammaproteobacteria bacterium 42_54_T18]
MNTKKPTLFSSSEQHRRECEVRYYMKKMGSNAIVAWALKKGDAYCSTLASELLKITNLTELERRVRALKSTDHRLKFNSWLEVAKVEQARQREDKRLRGGHGIANLPAARGSLA